MQAVFELVRHEAFHDGRRAVGRAVVYNQHVERLFQSEYGPDDVFYVFLFVVRRNDNYTV